MDGEQDFFDELEEEYGASADISVEDEKIYEEVNEISSYKIVLCVIHERSNLTETIYSDVLKQNADKCTEKFDFFIRRKLKYILETADLINNRDELSNGVLAMMSGNNFGQQWIYSKIFLNAIFLAKDNFNISFTITNSNYNTLNANFEIPEVLAFIREKVAFAYREIAELSKSEISFNFVHEINSKPNLFLKTISEKRLNQLNIHIPTVLTQFRLPDNVKAEKENNYIPAVIEPHFIKKQIIFDDEFFKKLRRKNGTVYTENFSISLYPIVNKNIYALNYPGFKPYTCEISMQPYIQEEETFEIKNFTEFVSSIYTQKDADSIGKTILENIKDVSARVFIYGSMVSEIKSIFFTNIVLEYYDSLYLVAFNHEGVSSVYSTPNDSVRFYRETLGFDEDFWHINK